MSLELRNSLLNIHEHLQEAHCHTLLKISDLSNLLRSVKTVKFLLRYSIQEGGAIF